MATKKRQYHMWQYNQENLYEKDGVYKIRTEVYGKGIQMWLRSQGDWIKNIDL